MLQADAAAVLRQEVVTNLPNGVAWMGTPHALLGGDTPKQLLDRGDWERVQDLVDSILYIGVS